MRNKKGWWLTSMIARVLMLLAAALLFLSYASMVVNPAKAWYMTALGLMFVPIAALNFFLLVWAIRRKSGALLIPLLALLPSLIFIGKYFQFSSGGEAPKEDPVKLVSYNVGRFVMGKGDFRNAEGRSICVDSVARFIKSTDADIICLQEFDLSGDYDVARFIHDHFPDYDAAYFMHINNEGAYGNVTLSRFPIAGKGRIQFEKSANQAIYTDLKIRDGATLRVYNCHFESYNISLSALAKSITQHDNNSLKDTEEKMKRSIIRRPEQVQQVMADIEECPLEAIVAGDFNDNPMSYTYHRLMKGRKDSFVEAGKGFGATYSVLWPFIRIDYILYPSHFKAVSNNIPRLRYSDHYPVVTEIAF